MSMGLRALLMSDGSRRMLVFRGLMLSLGLTFLSSAEASLVLLCELVLAVSGSVILIEPVISSAAA